MPGRHGGGQSLSQGQRPIRFQPVAENLQGCISARSTESAQLLAQLGSLLEIVFQLAVGQVHFHGFELLDQRFERALDILDIGEANVTPN